MKQRHYEPPAMGSISLLVSFAVLLMVLLSLLALGQVQSHRRLAEKSEKAVAEFYAADMEAEKILAMLRNGLPVEGVTEKDGIYSYSCPVSESRTLFVEVEKDTWKILRWETVSHPEAPEENLPVWTGD